MYAENLPVAVGKYMKLQSNQACLYAYTYTCNSNRWANNLFIAREKESSCCFFVFIFFKLIKLKLQNKKE